MNVQCHPKRLVAWSRLQVTVRDWMLWQCVCIMALLLSVRHLLPLYSPLSCLDSACGFHCCHRCRLTLLPGPCFCCGGSDIICHFFFFPLVFSISFGQLMTGNADALVTFGACCIDVEPPHLCRSPVLQECCTWAAVKLCIISVY